MYEVPEGYHVRFFHQRGYSPRWDNNKEEWIEIPSLKGGATYCYIEDADNKVIVLGVAHCSSDDHYSKRIGRDISFGRAMKSFKEVMANA